MKKNLSFGILITITIYLFTGFAFYVNDVRSSRSLVRICPENVTTEDQMQDCPQQNISLKEDWPTAVTVTVGWLPLMIMRVIYK